MNLSSQEDQRQSIDVLWKFDENNIFFVIENVSNVTTFFKGGSELSNIVVFFYFIFISLHFLR